ncbi:MAG: class I SAM-dependent methyltransferase [Candidatus Hodarchaeota archaeon]
MVHGPECIEAQFSWQEVLDIWKNFLPPIRPSIMDQQVYEGCIKKIKDRQGSSVLILGVTPELRMLAIKYCCRVVAVDLHTVMIKAMNRLMDTFEFVTCNEVIVKGYWLAMPFRRGEYDLILSDCSLNSLTKAETRRLLMEVKRLLKEDGYICMRVMIYPDEWTERSILDIFVKHRTRHRKNSKKILEDLYPEILCSIEAYDPISQKSSIAKARKEWRRLHHHNEISRLEFEAFEDVLAKGEYSPTILKRSEIQELLNQHFKTIYVKNGESKSMHCSPIYCLKPR